MSGDDLVWRVAEEYRVGETFVRIERAGGGESEGAYRVFFAAYKTLLPHLTSDHAFSPIELEDLVDAVNAARMITSCLEGRSTTLELARGLRDLSLEPIED